MTGTLEFNLGDKGEMTARRLALFAHTTPITPTIVICKDYKCIELKQNELTVDLFFDTESDLIQWAMDLHLKALQHMPMSTFEPINDVKHVNGVQP